MNIFRVAKPAIAMLQLQPLPGAFKYRGDSPELICEQALEDARVIVQAGFDGIQIQNNGDHPSVQQVGPETVAMLTMIVGAVRREFPQIGLGVLCNWDGVAAVAVAHASGADYIRVERAFIGAEVTSFGLISATCREVTRFHRMTGADRVAITADVYEFHAVQLGAMPMKDAALAAVEEGGAQALWISGKTPDQSLALLQEAKSAVSVPVMLGGGARRGMVADALRICDGVVVARDIKGGDIFARIDPVASRSFMDAVRQGRGY